MLTEDQIKTYQALYKNRFGKEIGREEAIEKGTKLLRLVELIYVPITEEEYKRLQKRRQETGNLKI
jgi:hypothetical protein